MKLIRNELFNKYTKKVITYHTDYRELTKDDLYDIFRFHCQGLRLLNEVVDYIYDLIQKDKQNNSKE